MMGQPIIQFEHISKAFAGQPVLRDLSLSIEAGEFVTVIGRSGCGKTTLLRLINRLITPDQGCVMVQGQDVAQTDPIALRRRIGYAIQSVGLFPHMTVEKNIAYVPSISGMDQWKGKNCRKLAEELLAAKFLQGIPLAGVVGGVLDSRLTARLLDYAALKYNRRFLLDHRPAGAAGL